MPKGAGFQMFLPRYSRTIYRLRWLIVAIWLLGTAASALFLPSLQSVVAAKGTSYLPPTAPSMIAGQLLKQIDPTHRTPSSVIIAITDAHGITTADTQFFNRTLSQMNRHRSRYHVSSVTAALNTNPSLASSFTSKDKTTMIALVGLPAASGQPGNVVAFQALNAAFAAPPAGSHVYFTGDAKIQQDNLSISQQGVAKSAMVTVILVLVILLAVFRSIVSPIVTLLSIGMTFLITSGTVAWLAELGLPTSTFTQTFLIAILFGAGTDYSIILMNRFREELIAGHASREEALLATLTAVSKTVLFSGLTVFVSFGTLYFAKFGLFQSAVGVAVGMLVTLLTCLIFIPAILAILGPILFWPRRLKVGATHPPFKIWQWSGNLSIRRPWLTLLVLLVVLTPVALLFTNNRTFDPMTDIPQAPSVKGFRVLANAFGQGKVMPVTLVLNTPANLRTSQGLATIQNITHSLASTRGVAEVDSATQPTGTVIQSFQLSNQDIQVSQQLGKIQSGLGQLGQGLTQAASQSSASQSGVQRLQAGSDQVTQGLQHLSQGVQSVAGNTRKLESGARQVAQGATALASGLQSLAGGLDGLNHGTTQLSGGLSQMHQGTGQLANGATQLSAAQSQLQSTAQQLANALALWAKAHPTDASQPSWQQIQALAQGVAQGETKATVGTAQLTSGLNKVNASSTQVAAAATTLQHAAASLASGSHKMASQAPQLAAGSTQVADGLRGLHGGVQQLQSGTTHLATGSQQVTGGIKQVGTGMQQLFSGVQQASTATTQLRDGVRQVNQFMSQSGNASRQQNPGFYVPESAIRSKSDLQKALNAYVSPDGHIAKFSVILTNDPYSSQALAEIPTLNRIAAIALAASPVHSGQILASGATAAQADLNSVSSADFVRTMVIVLGSICLLLMLMLRSVFTPLYIIGSLGGAYFVTMGIMQEVASHIMKEPGISWVAPFFIFLLLVALGVDYSIFLMSRYEEEIPTAESLAVAMRDAMVRMGGVIYSAALIMAGTFGSLAASGVTSLIEIASGVVIGLFIYTSVFLAFFVPAAAAVVGDGHVWPFGWRAIAPHAGVRGHRE